MLSVIIKPSVYEPKPYPKLRQLKEDAEDSGRIMIILFTNPVSGTLLYDSRKVQLPGTVDKSWDPSQFKDFDGKLEVFNT